MCTDFTTLAESNDYRHILQCEHGTIHLTWDLVTMYLNFIEFEQLIGLLDRGVQLTGPSKIGEPNCVLVYKEQGFYQLWLRNVGINLTPVDFLILVDMARAAFKEVHEKQTPELMTRSTGEMSQIFHRTVEASATISFSLN